MTNFSQVAFGLTCDFFHYDIVTSQKQKRIEAKLQKER